MLFLINFGLRLLPSAPVPLLPSFLVLTSNTPYFLAFAVGASIHAFRESMDLGRNGAIVAGLICVLILKFGGWEIFGPVMLPLFVLHLAYSFRIRLSADLSYGIYVLHFPCEQLLAAWKFESHGFVFFFLCSIVATTACATVSWFLVERPALRLK